jgi:hypothetical protein
MHVPPGGGSVCVTRAAVELDDHAVRLVLVVAVTHRTAVRRADLTCGDGQTVRALHPGQIGVLKQRLHAGRGIGEDLPQHLPPAEAWEAVQLAKQPVRSGPALPAGVEYERDPSIRYGVTGGCGQYGDLESNQARFPSVHQPGREVLVAGDADAGPALHPAALWYREVDRRVVPVAAESMPAQRCVRGQRGFRTAGQPGRPHARRPRQLSGEVGVHTLVDPLDLAVPASPRQHVVVDPARHRLSTAERTFLSAAQLDEAPYPLVVWLRFSLSYSLHIHNMPAAVLPPAPNLPPVDSRRRILAGFDALSGYFPPWRFFGSPGGASGRARRGRGRDGDGDGTGTGTGMGIGIGMGEEGETGERGL